MTILKSPKSKRNVRASLDETRTEIRILHIYLDERDLHNKVWHNMAPNGFTKARVLNDFPLREHKVALHVRRRRWTDSEGKNVELDTFPLTAKGTGYSKEFAAFFKEVYGYLPRHGYCSGAVPQD